MNFSNYESKFKIIIKKNWGWGGVGGGARVFFVTKNPILKNNWRGGGGVDGWTVKQAQTNLPLQLLRRWGHNNALMYKLCKKLYFLDGWVSGWGLELVIFFPIFFCGGGGDGGTGGRGRG